MPPGPDFATPTETAMLDAFSLLSTRKSGDAEETGDAAGWMNGGDVNPFGCGRLAELTPALWLMARRAKAPVSGDLSAAAVGATAAGAGATAARARVSTSRLRHATPEESCLETGDMRASAGDLRGGGEEEHASGEDEHSRKWRG